MVGFVLLRRRRRPRPCVLRPHRPAAQRADHRGRPRCLAARPGLSPELRAHPYGRRIPDRGGAAVVRLPPAAGHLGDPLRGRGPPVRAGGARRHRPRAHTGRCRPWRPCGSPPGETRCRSSRAWPRASPPTTTSSPARWPARWSSTGAATRLPAGGCATTRGACATGSRFRTGAGSGWSRTLTTSSCSTTSGCAKAARPRAAS